MTLGATHRLVYFDTADSNKVDSTTRIGADQVLVADAGGYFAGTEAEAVLQEVGQSVSQIWLPAARFGITGGAPTLTVLVARWGVWLLDAASPETISASVEFPANWNTINTTLVWTNAGAGAGDVRWTITHDNAAVGGSFNASGPGDALTATAGAQYIRVDSAITAGRAVTNANLYNLRVSRVAADAADTLANDAAFVGLWVTKAS